MSDTKQINVRFSRDELATIKEHADTNHRKLGPTVKYLTLEKLREEKLLPATNGKKR